MINNNNCFFGKDVNDFVKIFIFIMHIVIVTESTYK